MSVVVVPQKYENTIPVEKSGRLIGEVGTNALILAGKTAFEAAGEKLTEALKENRIRYHIEIADGYPTVEKSRRYGNLARQWQSDVVIGVGGGRVLDLAKAASENAGLPVVTIPTIPATCAAWSTLSVLYTEEGAQDVYVYRKQSPALILADKEILYRAPERYLIAGVADSIAKWYEVASNYNENQDDFSLRLQLKICELILEFLEQDFIGAYLENPDSLPEQVRSNAVDSIILLAGLSGSINGKVPYGGLAHHFYNQSTKVENPGRRLHGEAVIFGLMMQFVIEGKNPDGIRAYLKNLKALKLPVTLAELGLREKVGEKVRTIAQLIAERVPDYAGAAQTLSAQTIEAAIYEVDRLGRELSA